MAHFLHYSRREVVVVDYSEKLPPWFAQIQPEDQGFERPAFHVTRAASGPSTRVRSGDTIWLFSQLFSPWGKLPPGLDAKIDVESVSERKDLPGIYYSAARSSAWYPLSDATKIIEKLLTVNLAGQHKPILSFENQPVGQALRRIRELQNCEVLTSYSEKLTEQATDFVSYRLKDGTKKAFFKTKELVDRKRTVFWDRWSLPRRLAERREVLEDARLDRFIRSQIRAAKVVWGIDTPRYAELNSYSKRERDLAVSLGKLRIEKSQDSICVNGK